jgi:hypothetical protein
LSAASVLAADITRPGKEVRAVDADGTASFDVPDYATAITNMRTAAR